MPPKSSIPALVAVAALLALGYRLTRPWLEDKDDEDEDEDVLRLGVVLGSERRGGNTVGMGVYLSTLVPSLALAPQSPHVDSTNPLTPPKIKLNLDVVDLVALALPRTFSRAPAKPALPSTPPSVFSRLLPLFLSPSPDAAWSARVSAWDAVLFVAPEYNGTVPGILKSALDRLYGEWRGKPAGLVALGYEGGGRLIESAGGLLRELGMEVVGGVGVTTAGRRVTGAEGWLEEVREEVEGVVWGLVQAVRRRNGGTEEGD